MLAYLIEENRVLRRQRGGRRPRLTDDDRRKLAARAYWLGRRALREVATIVTPDTLPPVAPATHRAEVDLRKDRNTPSQRPRRDPLVSRSNRERESDVGLHADPRCAQESRAPCRTLNDCTDPADARDLARAGAPDLVANVPARALGRDRRRGFLHDRSVDVAWLGHLLHGLCHRPGLAARADPRSTPHPDEAFMGQVARTLSVADGGHCRVLICDRDAKWSTPVRTRLRDAGIRVIPAPYRAPNANAYAERVVRSIKGECLNRLIPFGERHVRQAVAEFVAHDHGERNHQGLRNELHPCRLQRSSPPASRTNARNPVGGVCLHPGEGAIAL